MVSRGGGAVTCTRDPPSVKRPTISEAAPEFDVAGVAALGACPVAWRGCSACLVAGSRTPRVRLGVPC